MRLTWFQRSGLGPQFFHQPSLAAAAVWPERRTVGRLWREASNWLSSGQQRRTILLTVLAVALGIFLVAQWQSQTAAVSVQSDSRDATIQHAIARLETEQAQLKKQIAALRAQATAEQVQAARSQSASAGLSQALAEQRALAGTVAVRGTGLEILLDDSTSHTLLPADNPDNYIVHEYQIRDIVNLLWGSGASAIAVNGERFVNSTSVYCVGSTILINDTRTSPPYHILAVGDTAAMQRALEDGRSLRDLKARSQIYGLVFKVVRVGPMTIPAFDGSVVMKHAVVAGAAHAGSQTE